MSTQREKAEELRRLHAAPEPLVLVNAWDAISAQVASLAVEIDTLHQVSHAAVAHDRRQRRSPPKSVVRI